MKVLGIHQFHQKKFKLLKIVCAGLAALLGKVPRYFVAVIYGFSGNGKTEFCIQLAKELCKHGKVAWLSYEQRHGFDLQTATVRNDMNKHNGKFMVIDPVANLDQGVTLLEDLDKYLSRRNSPDYVFFDSLDYTGFTWQDYQYLKDKYGQKKGLFFLSHSSKSGRLNKAISRNILFDGGMGLFVSNYICFPEKNRFGGFEPYVVYEERARKLNPTFFAKRVTDSVSKPKKKSKPKTTNKTK